MRSHRTPKFRAGHAAENRALLRRLALNLLRQGTRCEGGIKFKRLNAAAWDHTYLQSRLGLSALAQADTLIENCVSGGKDSESKSMETRENPLELESPPSAGSNSTRTRTGSRNRLTVRSLQLYLTADALSGGLIFGMVVFSPWAFGTTERWSVWVMNICGYALGLLLLTKLYIRFHYGYRPSRWDGPTADKASAAGQVSEGRWLVTALASLTALILGYCLVSALNARATYQQAQGSFVYHDCIKWLPHSYDSNSTWRAFWDYLALAFAFWGLRDWLLGRSAGEARAEHHADQPGYTRWLPQRLRWLLWLLSLNGALLAVEGIAQRISGTNKLLWLMSTRLNPEAVSQFGPYAYRSNGAQYLNLVWPVALGFWWLQNKVAWRRLGSPARLYGKRDAVLLACILVMAAGPIISTSRAGAIVAVAMMVAAAPILMLAMRHRPPRTRLAILLFFSAVFALGAFVGGRQLTERMRDFGAGLAGREEIYDTARSMAQEHPLFGIGPGAFGPMFQLYRTSLDEYWPAQLHNDWLETRITFGWFGSSFIALAFLVILMRGFGAGGIPGRWPFVMLLWLALAGCLVHARWDFPLQIYSILFLFLLLCAMLFSLSLRTVTANP